MTLVSDESLSAGAGWNSQVSATKIQLRARGCLPAGGCANLPNIYTVLQNTFVHGLNNLIQFYVSGLRSGECGSAAKQRIKSAAAKSRTDRVRGQDVLRYAQQRFRRIEH